jgi:ligand-binding SRPBCC domain-containing protein
VIPRDRLSLPFGSGFFNRPADERADMREVEVSRFVRATPTELRRHLSPATVVGSEETFTVREVHDLDDAILVTAVGGGLQLALRFESREDGLYYAQEGQEGPFESMETWLTLAPENEGTRLTARSRVSLGLPLAPLTDRIAAWKRRGELKRALENVASDVE